MLEVVIPLQVNVYAMMADMTWIAQVILIVHPIKGGGGSGYTDSFN